MKLLKDMEDFRKNYSSFFIDNKAYSDLEFRALEHKSDVRGEFQRDRDRIIHSRAFRRLSGKTQVFNSNKGDHYRTRLTHSLEVSQIGRTIGKLFGLNEDLIEAIALGHDLGHTPFGHVIERTLHDILKNNEIEGLDIDAIGGFKHNFQSLHLVDNIEMGYREFRGLNLTLAVRDGIIKHTGSKIKSGKTGEKEQVEYENLELGLNGIHLMDYEHAITLEGQIVALSDEIAQSTHDLEDGVRSKIIKIEVLRNDFKLELEKIEESIKGEKLDFDIEQFNNLNSELFRLLEFDKDNSKKFSIDLTADINNLINTLIDLFIRDAILTTKKNIEKNIKRNRNRTGIHSNGLVEKVFVDNSKYVKNYRQFISEYIYKSVVSSQEVAQSDSKAKYLIKQIFKAYYEDPRQLPDYALNRYFSNKGYSLDRITLIENKEDLQKDPRFIRMICDHIAGMTDNFAMDEYNNLYGVSYKL